MAIAWVKETFYRRGGTTTGVLSTQDRRHFIIKTTNAYDDFHAVGQAAIATGALPDIYDQHPKFPFWTRRRLSIDPRPNGGKIFWDAIAEYSSEPIPRSEWEKEKSVEQRNNPTKRVAQITFTQVQYQKAIREDIETAVPFVNSAGDPFPAQLIDDARLVIRWKKNVPTLPGWVLNLKNTVNKDPATIRGLTFPKETLKLSGLNISDLMIEGNFEYFELSGEYHYQEDGWKLKLLNAGYNQIDTNGDYVAIVGDDGTRATSPRPLKANGNEITDPFTTDPTYEEFQVYYVRDHNPVLALLPD